MLTQNWCWLKLPKKWSRFRFCFSKKLETADQMTQKKPELALKRDQLIKIQVWFGKRTFKKDQLTQQGTKKGSPAQDSDFVLGKNGGKVLLWTSKLAVADLLQKLERASTYSRLGLVWEKKL